MTTLIDVLNNFIEPLNVLNIAIGTTLGGVISFAISYYYFTKGKGLESLMHWIGHNLGDSAIRQIFPQFFGLSGANLTPTPTGPSDSDTPRISTIIVSPPTVVPGQEFQILFRVSDDKWNFPMAAGVSIIDWNGFHHAVNNASFGFMHVSIKVAPSEPLGIHDLTFVLKDSLQNTFQQKVGITVV